MESNHGMFSRIDEFYIPKLGLHINHLSAFFSEKEEVPRRYQNKDDIFFGVDLPAEFVGEYEIDEFDGIQDLDEAICKRRAAEVYERMTREIQWDVLCDKLGVSHAQECEKHNNQEATSSQTVPSG